MNIHREGKRMLSFLGIVLILLNLVCLYYLPSWLWLLSLASLIIFLLILQFFRNPKREIAKLDDSYIYAPADGKVVVIEEAYEPEYFQAKKLQVSIFMSPINVHVNRSPIAGKVNYYKYHQGKYLVAWHPKSSTENERTTSVIEGTKGEILVRQIAGALAKRIINYLQVDSEVSQGGEIGFIKFGSRVDLFLPLGTKINVQLEEKVKGNLTVIGQLP